MIINQNSIQANHENIIMPIVDINSRSSILSDLPNFLTATKRNSETQINEFIINFNFFIADPILRSEVSIFNNHDLIFGPSSPYHKESTFQNHQFLFRLQTEKEFLSRGKNHGKSYYEESPISEIMKSNVYKLSLEIKTISTIYKYITPVLIKNVCFVQKKRNSKILIDERKSDLIDYLIEIKRGAGFQMEDQAIPLTHSPISKKRKNLNDLNSKPKRKKLNSETIEKSDTVYRLGQLPENDCSSNWVFPDEHLSQSNHFFSK